MNYREREGLRDRLGRAWDRIQDSPRFVACVTVFGALLGGAAALGLGNRTGPGLALYLVFLLGSGLAIVYRSCLGGLFLIGPPLLVSLCLFWLRIRGYSVGLALLGAYVGYLVMGLEPWKVRFDRSEFVHEMQRELSPGDLGGSLKIGMGGVLAGVLSVPLIWGLLGEALGHFVRVSLAFDLGLFGIAMLADAALTWFLFRLSRVLAVTFVVGAVVIAVPLVWLGI